MAVAHDRTTTGTLVFGTTLTFGHLVSGSDRVLFSHVGSGPNGSGVVSGVTYNAVSLTLILQEAPNDPSGFGDLFFGYLTAPAAGTNDVVVTTSAAESTAAIATSYTGVDQTTPWDGQQTDRGSDAAATVTVTSATDNMVVGAIAASAFGSTTFDEGAGQTERADILDPDSNFIGISLSDEAGASSVTHSYTLSGSANHTMTAVNVRAAAGAPTEYTMTAEPAAVTLTPTDANLENHRRIAAESAAVTIAGTAATLLKEARLAAESLAIALTPTDAGLRHHRALDLESAAYAITGTDAALAVTIRLLAESLAVEITPTDAFFGLTRLADTIAYEITPTAANLEHHRRLSASSAGVDLVGTAAALEFHRALALESAAYLITGQDVTLSTGADLSMSAESAAYAITPTDAELLRGLRLVAESGAVIATGQDAALLVSLLLSAESSSLAITPTDVELASGFRMLAESAELLISPSDVDFVYDRAMDLASLAVLLSAQDVTLTYDGAPIVLVPTRDRIGKARGTSPFVRARR